MRFGRKGPRSSRGEGILEVIMKCRVYWGSHGCQRERGHEGTHECSCCYCPENEHTHEPDKYNVVCVAKEPYYGPTTVFYGEDSGNDPDTNR